jgi:hypothetical protein
MIKIISLHRMPQNLCRINTLADSPSLSPSPKYLRQHLTGTERLRTIWVEVSKGWLSSAVTSKFLVKQSEILSLKNNTNHLQVV